MQAQRAAQQRRLEEMRKQDRAKTDSAFSQLVKAQGGQRQLKQSQKSAVDALLEEMQGETEQKELYDQAQSRAADLRGRVKQTAGTLDAKREQDADAKSDRTSEDSGAQRRGAQTSAQGMAAKSHAHDESVGEAGASGRGEDDRQSEHGAKERGKDAKASAGAKASGQKGDLKAEDAGDKGGKGGNQGGKDGKPNDVPAGFRFNPALMAPVPVAKPRDMAGSDRLRAIANEIAQKIVERVRVGQNAAGKAEFQIDLRSNVLKGLSIKVSGSNGKISAVFSGSDRDVLKMLEEQADTLKSALGGRGLVLADFKVEERA